MAENKGWRGPVMRSQVSKLHWKPINLLYVLPGDLHIENKAGLFLEYTQVRTAF